MLSIFEAIVFYIGIFTLFVAILLGLCVLFFESIFMRSEHRVRKFLYKAALNDKFVLFENDATNYRFMTTNDLSLKIVLNRKKGQLFIYDGAGECLLNEYPVNVNPLSVISFLDRKYSREIRMKLNDLVTYRA